MASPWMTTDELGDRWHLTPKTLSNWKLEGRGPTPVKVGKRLLYRLSDVEKWEKEQERLARAG